MRQPPGRLADLVVDAGLLLHRAAEARTRDADERPPAVKVDDERAAAVAETGVSLALLVAGAEHLLVQLDGDGFLLVPLAADAVVDYRNEDLVQEVCAGLAKAERLTYID